MSIGDDVAVVGRVSADRIVHNVRSGEVQRMLAVEINGVFVHVPEELVTLLDEAGDAAYDERPPAVEKSRALEENADLLENIARVALDTQERVERLEVGVESHRDAIDAMDTDVDRLAGWLLGRRTTVDEVRGSRR